MFSGMAESESHPFLHRLTGSGYDSSGINPGGMYTGGSHLLPQWQQMAQQHHMQTGGNLPPQQMGGMQTGGSLPPQQMPQMGTGGNDPAYPMQQYGGWMGRLTDWGRMMGGSSY
jgi:hypothetical protein